VAQAASNLVGNAVQYSPEDSVVRVVARDEGERVRVEIHNEGPPIPAERLPHIFDPFVRGEQGAQASGPRAGLGLGLYITHEIVKAHGGLVQVRSNASEGTCFWLSLPRQPKPVSTLYPRSSDEGRGEGALPLG
jgi:phosphoserine phosphatase RsbU/P